MKILVLKNLNEIGKLTSSIISEEILKKPRLTLGLATGETVVSLYSNLVKLYENKSLDFSRVKTFNLDEYVGLGKEDRGSLRYFMDKHFFSKVNLKDRNINFLDGKTSNLKKEIQRYDSKIKLAGFPDLQILGIGRDGHIGFNEPGSDKKSGTRKVTLSEKTRKDNAHFFGSLDKVPKEALTLGIKEILKSKKILLLASGKSKTEAIRKCFSDSKVSEKFPASFLKSHKDFTLIVDKEAAKSLHVKKFQ